MPFSHHLDRSMANCRYGFSLREHRTKVLHVIIIESPPQIHSFFWPSHVGNLAINNPHTPGFTGNCRRWECKLQTPIVAHCWTSHNRRLTWRQHNSAEHGRSTPLASLLLCQPGKERRDIDACHVTMTSLSSSSQKPSVYLPSLPRMLYDFGVLGEISDFTRERWLPREIYVEVAQGPSFSSKFDLSTRIWTSGEGNGKKRPLKSQRRCSLALGFHYH